MSLKQITHTCKYIYICKCRTVYRYTNIYMCVWVSMSNVKNKYAHIYIHTLKLISISSHSYGISYVVSCQISGNKLLISFGHSYETWPFYFHDPPIKNRGFPYLSWTTRGGSGYWSTFFMLMFSIFTFLYLRIKHVYTLW